ncbi:MAG TPA: hypothetical protein VJV04_11265 [Nitrospiraceae bacterium]|nr:hypothetical protein [Nitrospiraceae bacterium]
MSRRRLFLRYAKAIAVMVMTVAFSCWGETKAEPLDRLIEEGVQILKEKHEIVHLQITRQLDVRQAQERLLASRQRWDEYARKLPPQKQAAILERIKQKDAMVLADLQRKWAAEGFQLPK